MYKVKMLLEKHVGQDTLFKKKVVHQPRLIHLTFLICLGKQTSSNAPYKGVNNFIQN